MAPPWRAWAGLVPTLDAASGTDALAAELSPCIDTRILNRDDDYILSGAVELPVGDETIGVTAKVSDGRVVIELATQGAGIAQAGVASERVTTTTLLARGGRARHESPHGSGRDDVQRRGRQADQSLRGGALLGCRRARRGGAVSLASARTAHDDGGDRGAGFVRG